MGITFTIFMFWNSMRNSIRFGVPTTYNHAPVPESLTARQQCCLLRTHHYLLYFFHVLEQYATIRPPCLSHLLSDSNAVSSERIITYFTFSMFWNSMRNSTRFGVPTTYNQAPTRARVTYCQTAMLSPQ